MFSKLGRFEIKDVIGRGAMGEVYLGVDPVLGREVAIKTIVSSALPEDQARQRFEREAKAAAILNHPNIVTIHEFGEDQGVLFIAMERLRGQDLEQALLQQSLTLPEALEVLAQVCDGLDAAHRNQIIHRDIKPSNIMIQREGRRLLVKIMDFGVARLKDSAMTVVGTVVGTVNYIAPEYIRSGEPDARSDLFAVGVMLYECISGKKPFDDGTASNVLYKIVNDPPDPLELAMLQGLNPVLRNMTERALAKDPSDRFQTAEELAMILRAAKDPSWSGRIEETTVRMRTRPNIAIPPVPAPPEPLVGATVITDRLEPNVPVPPVKQEIKPAVPEPKPLPKADPAKTMVFNIPTGHDWSPEPPAPAKPAAEWVAVAKAPTAEVVVPPELIGDKPDLAKTVVVPLQGHEMKVEPAKKVDVPGPADIANAKDSTQDFVVPAELVEDKAGLAKTVVVPIQTAEKKPEPLKPVDSLPPADIANAKDSTQDVVVPAELVEDKASLAKTMVVPIQPPEKKPEPMKPVEALAPTDLANAKDSTQDVVVPAELVEDKTSLAKTVVVPIQTAEKNSEPVKPAEAMVPADLAKAKDRTQDFVVPAELVEDKASLGKTVVVPIQTAEKKSEPVEALALTDVANAKDRTQDFVVPDELVEDKVSLAKTVVVPIQTAEKISAPVKPAEALAPADLANAKDRTQDFVVPAELVEDQASLAKTVVVPAQVPEKKTETVKPGESLVQESGADTKDKTPGMVPPPDVTRSDLSNMPRTVTISVPKVPERSVPVPKPVEVPVAVPIANTKVTSPEPAKQEKPDPSTPPAPSSSQPAADFARPELPLPEPLAAGPIPSSLAPEAVPAARETAPAAVTKKSSLPLVLTLVGLLVIGAGGFWFYRYKIRGSQSAPPPVASPVVIAPIAPPEPLPVATPPAPEPPPPPVVAEPAPAPVKAAPTPKKAVKVTKPVTPSPKPAEPTPAAQPVVAAPPPPPTPPPVAPQPVAPKPAPAPKKEQENHK